MPTPPSSRARSRRLTALLLLWCAAWVVGAAVAGEAFVRWRGHVDADGTFHYGGKPIHPWHVPVARVGELIAQYQASPTSYLRYDAELGWGPRPGATSRDGLYRANAAGMRAPVEYEAAPRDGVVRIALLGDSFMHGDDVAWDDSLAASLQRILTERGIAAEVLNFGVGGYGFDQALLRWRRDASRYRPDILVAGLQIENTARNVNIFRVLYYPPTVIPFSKPRFVLEGSALRPINLPTIPVERIVPTLEDIHAWEHAAYEHYLDPREYQPTWWSKSRLAAVLMEMARPDDLAAPSPEKEAMKVGSEAFDLTLAILRSLREEVARAGGDLFLLHLPTGPEAAEIDKRGRSRRASMRDAACKGQKCIDPSAAIVEVLRSGGMRAAYTPQHFTGAANAAVAEVVAAAVLPSAQAAASVLARRRSPLRASRHAGLHGQQQPRDAQQARP